MTEESLTPTSETSTAEAQPVLMEHWKGIPTRYWAAFLHNDPYYLEQINALRRGDRPAFNWASFLLGFGWMFYRKMLLVPLAYLLVIMAEGTIEEAIYYVFDVESTIQGGLSMLLGLTIGLLVGTYGNQLYLWHAERQIKQVLGLRPTYLEEAPVSMEQDLYAQLASKGGTSWVYVILLGLGLVAAGVVLFVITDLFMDMDA